MSVAAVISAGEGDAVPALGMAMKVRQRHLDGLFVVEAVIDPDVMIFPHTHSREDECSYLLSGELTYLIGDDVRVAVEGSYVVRPRGMRHAFWNATGTPARIIEMHTPATFDGFYDRVGAILTGYGLDTAQGRAAFDELSTEYGLVQHWDLIPELNDRYGIGRR
ncbi:cupin domain-containing protein [Acrocarpospora catenulata]|uniref:cupin domain-containing protein n=1 Tax=Acrocarpospora catenulata TaxID=2836182 RepID=UPI001BD9BF3B|nr:cupin domain-containing protein [Acrocarpospora catenulata]